MSDEATTAPSPRTRPTPNYAARRMLVSTVAITIVVAGTLLAWRFLRSDDDGTIGSAGDWDRLALVDRTTGEIVLLDEDGEPAGGSVGLGRVNDLIVEGDRMALVSNDRLVLTDGDGDPIEVSVERGLAVTPLRFGDGKLALVVGDPNGGNVRIVDAADGEVLDVGAAAEQSAPRLFAETVRASSDGTRFAVADAANFQTIVVESGEEGATFFPDQPIAVGDQLVATSQVVGRQADIGLFDRERRNQALVPTEIPAGGVMDGDRLLVVSADGTVYRIERGDEEAERIGDVAVPAGDSVAWVRPTFDGQRLVVAGPVFVAVIDLEGATVFTTTFASPIDVAPPDPDWSCLPVGGGDSYHSLISLDDGRQLADLRGLTVTGTASDGCTVVGDRGGIVELVGAEGTALVGAVRSAALGPDGRSVVVTSSSGRTELLRVDDEFALGEPVDLSAVAPASHLVAFLDG